MIKALDDILTYQVPIIAGSGDCVGSDCLGEFNMEEYLPFLLTDDKNDLLFQLDRTMHDMHSIEHIDWCGVYLRVPSQDHNELYHPALLKIVYRGEMSRGLFPLTEAFAKQSNNSTVGLTGKPVLVDDVRDYISAGGCYYECDTRVRAEYCHPLFNEAGEVIGIVDVESFTPAVFSDKETMKKVQTLLVHIEELLRQFSA